VLDRARLLDAVQLRALEERLRNFQRNTGRVVVVHTTPSLEGLAVNEYSSRIAAHWRVLHPGLASGAVLTVAPNERKVNVEAGPRLRGVLADPRTYRAVREQILEEFRRRNMPRGIEVGVDAMLLAIARAGQAPAAIDPAPPVGVSLQGTRWLYQPGVLVLLLAALLALLWLALRAERRDGQRSDGFARSRATGADYSHGTSASHGRWQRDETGSWTYFSGTGGEGDAGD